MPEKHRLSADQQSHGLDNRQAMRIPALIGVLLLEACSASKGLPPVDSSHINPKLLDKESMGTVVDYDRRFAEHALYVKTSSVLNEAKSSGLGVGDVQSLSADLIMKVFSTAFYKAPELEDSTGVNTGEPKGKAVIDRSEQGIAFRRASRKLHAIFYEAKISYFSHEEARALVDTVSKEVYGETNAVVENASEPPAQ